MKLKLFFFSLIFIYSSYHYPIAIEKSQELLNNTTNYLSKNSTAEFKQNHTIETSTRTVDFNSISFNNMSMISTNNDTSLDQKFINPVGNMTKKDKVPSEDDFINELTELIDENENNNVDNGMISNEPTTDDIKCSSDNAEACQCELKCRPLKAISINPCICEQFNNFQPLTLPSIPVISDPQLPLVNKPCSAGDLKCSCALSCSPYSIKSYEPCSCDFNSNENTLKLPVDQCMPNDNTCDCKKQCFPNTVESVSPCSCNYNQPTSRESIFSMKGESNLIVPLEISSCAHSCSPLKVLSEDPCLCNIMDGGFEQSLLNGMTNLIDPTFIQPPSYDFTKVEPIMEPLNQLSSAPQQFSKHLVEAGGWYLGCYNDKEVRDLKIKLPIPYLTAELCVVACRAIDHKYSAVQYSYLCFCGSKFGRYGKADESKCSYPCQGNNYTICGGSWVNSVYSTDGKTHDTSEFNYDEPDSEIEIQFQIEYPQSNSKKINNGISSESAPTETIPYDVNVETTTNDTEKPEEVNDNGTKDKVKEVNEDDETDAVDEPQKIDKGEIEVKESDEEPESLMKSNKITKIIDNDINLSDEESLSNKKEVIPIEKNKKNYIEEYDENEEIDDDEQEENEDKNEE